ncbi:remorin isoform X2 [Ziziphus jujuba]|uniref:Remorin isoform X2 n=1 Tax=Ziziphus jujuba TaxID=326968 RepID=A0ABM3IJZ4_ZIZJJ|nr:remorin isoform X2 [Ziziphus jujuba]
MDSLVTQNRTKYYGHGGDKQEDSDEHFATAIAAAAFAVHSLEEAELQYQKTIKEGLGVSRTSTKTRKDGMPSSGMVTRRLSNKEAKGEVSITRPAGSDHKASESTFPSRYPSVRADRNQNQMGIPSRQNGVRSRADVWEIAQMEKIRKRYEKMKSTILAWENKRKMKVKQKNERTKSILEQRRAQNQRHYQNKMARIDDIAKGARAQMEEKRRQEESEVKEKAKRIRSTGKVPVTCFCFSCY